MIIKYYKFYIKSSQMTGLQRIGRPDVRRPTLHPATEHVGWNLIVKTKELLQLQKYLSDQGHLHRHIRISQPLFSFRQTKKKKHQRTPAGFILLFAFRDHWQRTFSLSTMLCFYFANNLASFLQLFYWLQIFFSHFSRN